MGGLAPRQGGGNANRPLINYQFSANSFMPSALSPHFPPLLFLNQPTPCQCPVPRRGEQRCQHCELDVNENPHRSLLVMLWNKARWLFSCYVMCLCDPIDCSTPESSVLCCLLELFKFMSIESVMPSNHLILWRPLLLLPSIFPRIRVFSNESALHIRWPKYWSHTFCNSPSNEYSGLISFRIDWLDIFAVQGTLKSLLQHQSWKASILQCSAFSHAYMTAGKTIALTRWTFVGKVMLLLFNMPSRFVIAFLPKNKYLSISWLQSPSTVILEPKKIKSLTVPTFPPSICRSLLVIVWNNAT